MQEKKEPIIEAIWALMAVYTISLPELEDFRGRKMYEDMVEEDPDEKQWIEENVDLKVRKQIKVKDGNEKTVN